MSAVDDGLATLRASLAASQARVSELESENSALLESFKSEHARAESITKRETWYNAEIERLNGVIDVQSVALTQFEWQPIESAPRNGTEILGWRDDAGAMMIRWTAPIDFLSERELIEVGDDSSEAYDWFYADFICGGRLEGEESPTHWMPLPSFPVEVVTPRKCAPDCYRKGWSAAIEAAIEVCYNFPAKYPLSPKETAAVCGDNIRALVPPADCGDCNPLAPITNEFDGIMCQCYCGCMNQATRYVDGMPSCDPCYFA